MKALLVALILAGCGGAGEAQTCPTSVVDPNFSYASEPAWDLTTTRIRQNSAGYLAYWYGVPKADGSRALSFAYLQASAVTPSYIAGVASDVAASGATAALRARATLDPNSMAAQAIWCPWWPEMLAGQNIPPPVPVGHFVLSTPTYLLRLPSTLSPLRSLATKGARCSCPLVPPVIDGKTYCTFPGAIAPSVVAECS